VALKQRRADDAVALAKRAVEVQERAGLTAKGVAEGIRSRPEILALIEL
jgi:hypothetical protein